jgi:hypothetical protein
MLVQVWGLVAAVIVAFNHGVLRAVALVVLVGVMHWVFSKVSNGLMLFHQRTMSTEDLRGVQSMAYLGVTPKPWRVIATVCGVLFFVSANAVILMFLTA